MRDFKRERERGREKEGDTEKERDREEERERERYGEVIFLLTKLILIKLNIEFKLSK